MNGVTLKTSNSLFAGNKCHLVDKKIEICGWYPLFYSLLHHWCPIRGLKKNPVIERIMELFGEEKFEVERNCVVKVLQSQDGPLEM